MHYLLAGILVFFGMHSAAIVAPGWRDRMAGTLGEFGWKAIYALVSLAGLWLMVKGYGLARAEPVLLYEPPAWLKQVAVILLLPAFPLVLAAYLPGRIKAGVGHPMLVATKLWATTHLLANGTLADVILFGSFLAWAVADRISLKRRVPRPGLGLPEGRFNDLIAVAGGFGLYVWFLYEAHMLLVGVPPLAG
ncbi:MAG: NnrU family protein [Steroidobacteraceae bacterium]|jgi:uncharacterized membrane protein